MDTPSFEDRISYLSDYRLPVEARGTRIYWMQSAQRVRDNMALNYAARRSAEDGRRLSVLFFLSTSYPGANIRHFWFMMQGLKEAGAELESRGLSFYILAAPPWEVLPAMKQVGEVVTDRGYLRHLRQWRARTAAALAEDQVPLIQIESEVVIPTSLVSDKKEYAAATIRRKITRQWLPYLNGHASPEDFFMGEADDYIKTSLVDHRALEIPDNVPVITSGELADLDSPQDFTALLKARGLPIPNEDVSPSEAFHGGGEAGRTRLEYFLNEVFPRYGEARNDPAEPAQSEISPYLHFGMLSPLRVAWEAVIAAADLRQNPKLNPSAVPDESLEAFLEELIVRRELAKNYVLHNPDYDSYRGIPEWAANSLEEHRSDPRPVLYSREQLERAETFDPYWNACQNEMRSTGKMHGYMRMYWGKKVIEWSRSPEEAFDTLIYLNDRYELDGRDENGYAGISWCFGTHDRGWTERAVFGKIRYMNDRGLERKFRIKDYAARWQ
jgi:deoxyribodipyrimidine photo-lyase